MNEKPLIFPLPAGTDVHEQAAALARAAWLMSAPGDGEPPPLPSDGNATDEVPEVSPFQSELRSGQE